MTYIPSVAFLTGSVGTGEWIVLFVVILIVVGPKRLPEIARKIGRTMEMFRRAADEFKDQLLSMDQETPASNPSPDPYVQSDTPSQTDMSESYDKLYPDSADYPGNEGQAENGSSDSLPDTSGAAVPPDDGASAEKQMGEGV